MTWDKEDDTTVYYVVVNHEEQYSIWPTWKDLPPGWWVTQKSGRKQECLDYIQAVWGVDGYATLEPATSDGAGRRSYSERS